MGGMMQMIPGMVNDIRENVARGALMNTVKFVVHETATPSPEMVSFAVVAGASPTTQGERDAYLDMLKNIARKTPAVVQKFSKPKVVNGTETMVLDTLALDAFITRKAMQYGAASKARSERKKKEEAKQRKHELEMLRTSQMHELNMIAMMGVGLNPPANQGLNAAPTTQPPGLDAFFMDSTSLFGSPVNTVQHNNQFGTNTDILGGNSQPNVPPANMPPANDGMMSLSDIYRMLDQNVNTQNNNNAQVNTPQPQLPPSTAPPSSNLDFSALLLGSMPMK